MGMFMVEWGTSLVETAAGALLPGALLAAGEVATGTGTPAETEKETVCGGTVKVSGADDGAAVGTGTRLPLDWIIVAVTGHTVVNELMVEVMTIWVLLSAGQFVISGAQLVTVISVVAKTVLVVWKTVVMGVAVMFEAAVVTAAAEVETGAEEPVPRGAVLLEFANELKGALLAAGLLVATGTNEVGLTVL